MGKRIKVAFCPLKGGEKLNFYYTPSHRFHTESFRIDYIDSQNDMRWSAHSLKSDPNIYLTEMSYELDLLRGIKLFKLKRDDHRLSTKEFKTGIVGLLRPNTRSYISSELLFHEADWIRENVAALDWTKE